MLLSLDIGYGPIICIIVLLFLRFSVISVSKSLVSLVVLVLASFSIDCITLQHFIRSENQPKFSKFLKQVVNAEFDKVLLV